MSIPFLFFYSQSNNALQAINLPDCRCFFIVLFCFVFLIYSWFGSIYGKATHFPPLPSPDNNFFFSFPSTKFQFHYVDLAVGISVSIHDI